MDAFDIFKKLTSGAKFDTKKFYDDAVKFQIVQPKKPQQTLVAEKAQNENDDETQDEEQPVLPEFDDDDNDEDGVQLLRSVSSVQPVKNKKKKVKTAEQLAQLKQEKINQFRNQNRINVSGTDIPEPIDTFEALQTQYNLHPQLMKNITNLGYSTPTPIQMQAIPVMLKSREILACAPTGSGKTAAFLIPVLHTLKGPKKLGFRAVVVSPTRELARQTYLECRRLTEGLGFRVHIIDKIGKAMKKFGPSSSQKFDILVTTPNRLVYLINQEPPVLNLKNVEWLIVDESDKLFETGTQGFRDQLAVIYKACSSSNIRHAMFSATFAFEVEEWCKLNLDNVITVSIGIRNTTTDLVKQELIYVGNELGKLVAFRDLVKQGLKPPVLVFVQTKERAKELFNELIYDAINVDVIHADRTQLQRDNVVKSFRDGKIWVLICTELMGRGIDFKGVNLVINYDFPPTIISYIHRIGRTGRAGRPGRAVTFFTEDDVVNLRSIAQVMRDSGCEVPEYMLQLKKPKKKEKRKLKQAAPKRKSISTVPLYDIEKANKRRKMIAKSKRKKAKLE